jgi:hypothetical protein
MRAHLERADERGAQRRTIAGALRDRRGGWCPTFRVLKPQLPQARETLFWARIPLTSFGKPFYEMFAGCRSPG